MFRTRKGQFTILLLAIFWSICWYFSYQWEQQKPVHAVNISASARHHILEGDARGGGHRHGMAKECKTEFPANWDDQSIIDHVMEVASNDNLNWRRQQNGYYVGEESIEGVRMRVVLNRERDGVVTAYPLNGLRNPCLPHTPANDNYN